MTDDIDQDPPLAGRSVVLRPVLPRDYDLLRVQLSGETLGPRWRHRGATPSPDQFVQGLWAGILCQFIVTEPTNPAPRGLVVCYNANLHSRFAYVAVTKLNWADRTPLVMKGTLLFLNYLFENWGLRKIYAEVPEFNLAQFQSAVGTVLKQEACLIDHWFFRSRYWDEYSFAIYAEEFSEAFGKKLQKL